MDVHGLFDMSGPTPRPRPVSVFARVVDSPSTCTSEVSYQHGSSSEVNHVMEIMK